MSGADHHSGRGEVQQMRGGELPHPEVCAHLILESVRVALGSRVTKGQVIGLAGNTGFSSGPHRHFAVEKHEGMKAVSLPFAFEGGAPEEGPLLSSGSPGDRRRRAGAEGGRP